MIYHIPGRTAVSVTLDTIAELRERSPCFVGMKHAVNDLGFVSECLAVTGDDFRIFVGLEELSFPMMAVGACGLMNAVGNLARNRCPRCARPCGATISMRDVLSTSVCWKSIKRCSLTPTRSP
ncbi:MAG: hypothetical protein CM1200mP20_15560 [Pseudomonadota bacterium]|nr:MAG: hypothetical protein CM1200mP20_15560 [Pseudomonadota bacterium]